MIGKVINIYVKYYDARTKRNQIKQRPALVIAKADESDYTVLPVSSVTDKSKVHPIYDMMIDPAKYPLLGLSKISYLRIHKQLTVHRSDINDVRGDMKSSYRSLYDEALNLLEEWNKDIQLQARL